MALRSLYSFSRHQGWDEVEKFLQDELQTAYRMMGEDRDEVNVRRLQGRSKFIREFLELVRDAPVILEKLKGSTL